MKAEEFKPTQAAIWYRPGKRYAERVTVFRVDADTNQVIIIDQKGKFRAVSADNLAPAPTARSTKDTKKGTQDTQKEQDHA